MAFVLKQPDLTERGVMQVMGSRLVEADTGTPITIGGENLPADAVIHQVVRVVREFFNDSGADALLVGDAGDNDRHCVAGDNDITATGTLNVGAYQGALFTAGGHYHGTAGPITATIVGPNGDATTGVVDVYVFFTLL